MHKFVLLILAFVSQDEAFSWMQDERVENFRRTGVDRKAFEMILDRVKQSCSLLNIDARARDMLIEELVCLADIIYGNLHESAAIAFIFDDKEAFETMLVKAFYSALDRSAELKRLQVY